MTDVELTRALERCEVPNQGFRHADHLRVALVYLTESPSVEAAIERMAATLRRFATAVGKPGKYSQGTTDFWMHQVAAARAVMPGASPDMLFAAYPRLLDKTLIRGYYSDDATPTGTTDPSSDAPHRALSRGAA